MNQDRFFKVTLTDNWIEVTFGYHTGANYKELAERLQLPAKRITNDRFREIEKTGHYYRITEQGKGGKSFIMEVI